MHRGPAPDVEWSTRSDEAAWLAARLAPPGEGVVTSVVPGGFESYARLLHPLPADGAGTAPVRWSQVAEWSGRRLRPDAQFHAVAFPVGDPGGPPPWGDRGPGKGTLGGDAEVLLGVLGAHTSTPDRCWCCLWDGYGWNGAVLARRGGGPSPPDGGRVPDPVPPEVRQGPRVELPWRTYLLYTGPIESALAFVPSQGQTPNLFWPADHAWCVATEIDLCSTYVGGSAALVEQLLQTPGIEVLPAGATDSTFRVEPWVEELAASAADTLLRTGEAVVDTGLGTLTARLGRTGFLGRRLVLGTAWARAGGGRRGGHRLLGRRKAADLRDDVVASLEREIVFLAG